MHAAGCSVRTNPSATQCSLDRTIPVVYAVFSVYVNRDPYRSCALYPMWRSESLQYARVQLKATAWQEIGTRVYNRY